MTSSQSTATQLHRSMTSSSNVMSVGGGVLRRLTRLPKTLTGAIVLAVAIWGVAQPAAAQAVNIPSLGNPGSTTLGPQCPPGSSLDTVEWNLCYPACGAGENCPNCTTTQAFWGVGSGGAVPTFDIPQFNPAQPNQPNYTPGTLVEVRVEYTPTTDGTVCFENPDPNCCTFSIDYTSDTLFLLTDSGPVQYLLSDIAPTVQTQFFGVALAATNGVVDCVPGVVTGGSDGTCNSDDYFVSPGGGTTTFAQVIDNQTQTLLDNWTGTGLVALDHSFVDAGGGGHGCTNTSSLPELSGRVSLKVTYVYCKNAPPSCVPPAAPYEVDENPDAADNSVKINLMELVQDIDGCINCNTFRIIQQPLEAENLLATSCSAGGGTPPFLGDINDVDIACTSCVNCTVRYVPKVGADFCGTDSFKFRVKDDQGASVVCEVFINVNPVNESPVCVTGIALTPICEGDTATIDLRPYVMDPDDGVGGVSENCGWGIDYSSMTATSNCGGSLIPVTQTPGTFRFTAPVNTCGPCEISFNVCDTGPGNEQLCIDPSGPQCTVNIEILPKNEAPVCFNAGPLPPVCEGETVRINFRPYVVDPDDVDGCGAGLDYASILPTSNCGGTFAPAPGQPAGWFDFTAPVNFCGPCPVSLAACDQGQTNKCSTGVLCLTQPCALSIEVLPKNEQPVCVAGPALQDVCEGETIRLNFRPYVTDPDDVDNCGAGLDYSSIQPSASCGGLFVPAPGQPAGWFDYTPAANFCGSCTITLEACDLGMSNACSTGVLCLDQPCQLSINVVAVNEQPICVAGPSLGSVLRGEVIRLDFRPYVSDPDDVDGCGAGLDDSSIMPSSMCGGSFAPAAGQPAGIWDFTAPSAYCGPCEIKLDACDLGVANSCNPVGPLCIEQQCSLTIQIDACNQAPICATGPTIECNEDETCLIDLRPYVSDPDDDGLGCAPIIDPMAYTGSVDCPGATLNNLGGGIFSFKPPLDYCGPCQITFTVCDTGGVPACADGSLDPLCVECVVDLNINPVNDPPVAVDDHESTPFNTPVFVDLCVNDYDVDDLNGCGCLLDCTSIQIVGGGVSDCGTLLFDTNAGMWQYTPAPDFVGDCCFDYLIYDRDPTDGTTCDFDEGQVCITVMEEACLPNNQRKPSSLLLYPEFDNREGYLTIHSITNSSPVESINVKMEFVSAEDCSRADRSVALTPNDTFTFLTNAYIAEQTRGYAYMYAQCGPTGPPVVFNHLIGNMLVMDGFEGIAYGLNPVSFLGIGMDGAGNTIGQGDCGYLLTDFNDDGLRGLDGIEYDPVPDEILIPHFLGQTSTRVSELILIGLTGGAKFETTLDFLIFNDNEEVFSTEYRFNCWERTPLMNITALFSNDYLANATNQDPEEVWGEPSIESGWIRINGGVATSSNTSLPDPAFYAILVESHGPNQMASDLPFGLCAQTNGALLSRKLNGE